MKQLHKQHWLIICMILVMIVSASGMDVTSLPQGHSPKFSANGSLIQTTTVQNSSLELCSQELLDVRLIQPRLSNARPVTLRQDGRQQHDLTLLYTIAVLSICTFFSRRDFTPAIYRSTTFRLATAIRFIHDKDGAKADLLFQ